MKPNKPTWPSNHGSVSSYNIRRAILIPQLQRPHELRHC